MRWPSYWGAFSCAVGIGLGSLTTSALASPRERPEAPITTSFGARLGPMSKELAERLGVVRHGAVVEGVERKSLAAKAGLRVGDVILGAGSEPSLSGPEETQGVLERQPRGKPIRLQLLRQGEPIDVELSLPKNEARGGSRRRVQRGGISQKQREERKEPMRVPRIGASVADARSGGALVRTVELEFPPALLEPGDIISSVNDRPVRSAEDLAHIAGQAPPGTPLILRVRRHGQIRVIGLRLGASQRPTILGGGPPGGERRQDEKSPEASADDAES